MEVLVRPGHYPGTLLPLLLPVHPLPTLGIPPQPQRDTYPSPRDILVGVGPFGGWWSWVRNRRDGRYGSNSRGIRVNYLGY